MERLREDLKADQRERFKKSSGATMTKVQMRDYSFLLSDAAAAVPPRSKNSQRRNVSPRKSEAVRMAELPREAVISESRSSGSAVNKKMAMQKPTTSSRLHGLGVRVPASEQLFRKGETEESRKRTAASRSLPRSASMRKSVFPILHPPVSKQLQSRRGDSNESRMPISSSRSLLLPAIKKTVAPLGSHPSVSNQPLSRKGENRDQSRKPPAISILPPTSSMQKPVAPSVLHPSVSKQALSREGENRESRKQTTASILTPKYSMQKPEDPPQLHPPVTNQPLSRKGEGQDSRNATAASIFSLESSLQKPAVKSLKLRLSIPKEYLLRKAKILQKHEIPQPHSEPKVTQSQSLAKSSAPDKAADDCSPKKRPRSHDDDKDDDLDYAIREIRKIIGYNPRKYVDDEDDKNIETNFQDILREENRSARVAGKEDREELRKIQEVEKRERLEKTAKKRKIENKVRKAWADLGLDGDD